MESIKNGYKKSTTSIKNKYNKEKNERKVKNDEIRRQRTATYRFKVIKKMKELYDLCLDESYDRDLKEIYVETLNNVLMKKIIGVSSNEVFFKFTMDNHQEQDQFVNPFVVFVRNTIDHYTLEELKCIDHYVSKFLK